MGRKMHPTPRGVTLVKELLARGIHVCAASDNVHDPFNPFGNYDLLQIANLNAHVAHLSGEAEVRASLAMVTNYPARLLKLSAQGVRTGAPADLVIVDTVEPLHSVTTVPPRLATFKQGKLLVQTTIDRQWYGSYQFGRSGIEPIVGPSAQGYA